MKKYSSSLLFSLFAIGCMLVVGCQTPEKPKFKDIRNVRVLSATSDKIEIQADAIIENPNMVAISVVSADIKVAVNDVDASEVMHVEDTEIPANSERAVAMRVSFPPSQLAKGTGIGGLLNMALSKSVKVNYKGSLTLKVMGVSFDVPIDEEKQVSLQTR